MVDTTDMPSDEAREFARKHFDGDIDAAVLLDAFAAPYRARAEAVERALEDEQKAHLITVDQRDEAEDAISQIYTAVTGRMPKWSNAFCYLDALHDVEANITACFAEAEAEKAKRDALTAQVAALWKVVGGLITLAQETADHGHQASDWGVFVRDAQAALTDTQDTAARHRAGAGEVAEEPKWWCPTCKESVPGEHVTFFETHDERAGGCGKPVT